jgi:GNAT superfamily N-acetyltransferase
VNSFRKERGNLVISTHPDCIDTEAVLQLLEQETWWTGLSRESLDCALRNSLCFSLIEGHKQIGVARVITDYVTYAYLCDVCIMKERRGHGLGSWLIRSVLEHPDLSHLKRVALITHDAQTFYHGLDFRFPSHPNCYMERLAIVDSTATAVYGQR